MGKPFDQTPYHRDSPIDDRWTEQKLAKAGWTFEWEKVCNLCGEEIRAYRKPGADGRSRLLILDAHGGTGHSC